VVLAAYLRPSLKQLRNNQGTIKESQEEEIKKNNKKESTASSFHSSCRLYSSDITDYTLNHLFTLHWNA
jgi:hypothetical protein